MQELADQGRLGCAGAEHAATACPGGDASTCSSRAGTGRSAGGRAAGSGRLQQPPRLRQRLRLLPEPLPQPGRSGAAGAGGAAAALRPVPAPGGAGGGVAAGAGGGGMLGAGAAEAPLVGELLHRLAGAAAPGRPTAGCR